jgi:hypothetical protein
MLRVSWVLAYKDLQERQLQLHKLQQSLAERYLIRAQYKHVDGRMKTHRLNAKTHRMYIR